MSDLLKPVRDAVAKHRDPKLIEAAREAYERFRGDYQVRTGDLDEYTAMLFQVAFTYGWKARSDPIQLRDDFAGKALPACIRACSRDDKPDGMTREDVFATAAYRCADAMLKAREK